MKMARAARYPPIWRCFARTGVPLYGGGKRREPFCETGIAHWVRAALPRSPIVHAGLLSLEKPISTAHGGHDSDVGMLDGAERKSASERGAARN